jgi:hypothetical protein
LYELQSPSINTSHYTSTTLTHSADHEPIQEWQSENEIEPDVEKEEEQAEEEIEEGILIEERGQVKEETEETIVVEEGVRADDEPESTTTALLYYSDPKNSPNPTTLSKEILKKPRCREVGEALHDPPLRRSRELVKSPNVRGGSERARMHSSCRSTPWSTLLNSSEAPRI